MKQYSCTYSDVIDANSEQEAREIFKSIPMYEDEIEVIEIGGDDEDDE